MPVLKLGGIGGIICEGEPNGFGDPGLGELKLDTVCEGELYGFNFGVTEPKSDAVCEKGLSGFDPGVPMPKLDAVLEEGLNGIGDPR